MVEIKRDQTRPKRSQPRRTGADSAWCL